MKQGMFIQRARIDMLFQMSMKGFLQEMKKNNVRLDIAVEITTNDCKSVFLIHTLSISLIIFIISSITSPRRFIHVSGVGVANDAVGPLLVIYCLATQSRSCIFSLTARGASVSIGNDEVESRQEIRPLGLTVWGRFIWSCTPCIMYIQVHVLYIQSSQYSKL